MLKCSAEVSLKSSCSTKGMCHLTTDFISTQISVVLLQVSPVMRKLVFGVCDQLRLKPACSATETSYGLEMLDLAIILSKQ